MKMILAAAVFFTASTSGTAATVYQSLPSLTVDPVQAGYCSGCGPFLSFRVYDSFTLASAATIQKVSFVVDDFYPSPSFSIGFFNVPSAGAAPGSVIASYDFTPATYESAVAIPTASERTRTLITVDIGGLALAAGTYDFSPFSGSGLSIPAYAKPGNTLYQSGTFFQSASFYADRGAAFALYDNATAAVPEPAAWAMMIGGFGLIGTVARRRRFVIA